MTEAKDWITAQPKANEPPERTPEQRAAFEQLLRDDGELYDVRSEQTQQTDVERVARAIVSELVGPNEWKEMGAAEIQTACDAARAALSAMHPSVSVDWERIEQIKHQHIATSHDIEHGNHRWDDFSAEAIHADRAFLLSLIEQSLPIAAARGEG